MNLREKPFYLTEEENAQVYKTLSELTVEQKAGQLFCVMATQMGPSSDELDKMVSDYSVGGILFRPAPGEWIRKQYERLDQKAVLPLLKAANLEEGGTGAMSDGTFFSWPMGVAATGDVAYAEKLAEVCANEGRSIGVNWTFSPVTDINYDFRNPITNIRTFGNDPDRVLDYCTAYVKTLQGAGVAACAKHFPGDGVDYRDQHLHPTYNSLTAGQWYASYGRNYQALIDMGLMSIMVGHIAAPYVEMDANPSLKFEDCMPATLSPTLLKGVLRERFGFNGLLTSDATIMTGFIQAMERRRAIPFAIEAGLDMLVFCVNFYEDYQYMLDGIRDGILSEQRLNEAVLRILAMKTVLNRNPHFATISEQNRIWQRECADKSITLVKNTRNILPLTPEKFPEIELVVKGEDQTGEGEKLSDVFAQELQKAGFQVRMFDPQNGRVTSSAGLSQKHLRIHLANIGAISNNTSVRLFWAMPGAGDAPKFIQEENDIFISFANPYHLQDVPRVKTYINAYNNSRTAVEVTVEKLLGKSEFSGISPVDAFCGLLDTRL